MNKPKSGATGVPEVLAVIPARGGSKSIPRKNIADLCGLPLLAYSIRAALASKRVSRVIVSTEDQEIAEVAVAHGAEVPFMRPDSLSMDDSSPGDVMKDILHRLKDKGYSPDITVELFPTHPFRTPLLIDEMTEMVLEEYSAALTVKPIFVSPGRYYLPELNGGLTLLSEQDLCCGYAENPEDRLFFRPYGLASVKWNHSMKEGRKPLFCRELCDPVSFIDIDELSDLELARYVIQQNLFDFGLA